MGLRKVWRDRVATVFPRGESYETAGERRQSLFPPQGVYVINCHRYVVLLTLVAHITWSSHFVLVTRNTTQLTVAQFARGGPTVFGNCCNYLPAP